MEILSSPEDESKNSPEADTTGTTEDLQPVSGSTGPDTERASAKASTAKARAESEERRKRDLRVTETAREMLAKFGISDRTGRK